MSEIDATFCPACDENGLVIDFDRIEIQSHEDLFELPEGPEPQLAWPRPAVVTAICERGHQYVCVKIVQTEHQVHVFTLTDRLEDLHD